MNVPAIFNFQNNNAHKSKIKKGKGNCPADTNVWSTNNNGRINPQGRHVALRLLKNPLKCFSRPRANVDFKNFFARICLHS